MRATRFCALFLGLALLGAVGPWPTIDAAPLKVAPLRGGIVGTAGNPGVHLHPHGRSARASTAARSPEVLSGSRIAARATGCEGGLRNDDGTFEDSIFSAALLAGFEAPARSARFRTVCICLSSTVADTFDYDLLLYGADGPGGAPGTELARIPARATGVSGQQAFFSHDVSALDLDVPDQPYYLGVDTHLIVSDLFVCADADGPSTQPLYTGRVGMWQRVEIERALGIRSEVAYEGGCVPGPERLCIDDQPGDGRFAITLQYSTVQGGGASGDASAVSLGTLGITDGGVFSFFGSTNPEVLAKVLDGCGINDHWWVFFAASTTVGFTLEVEDTVTARMRTYTNLDQTPAAPVTDIEAFPCP